MFIISLIAFGYDLAGEPSFVDEWAYVSQSFYAAKLFQPNDPAWLEYAALDLPPLAKYLVGGSLSTAGYHLGSPAAANRWYHNTHTTFGPPAMLTAARRPMVLAGALGCVTVYLIGTLAADVWVGLVAAGLLALNPLYRMLARRAMSDVPAEALILATLAFGLWAWKRVWSEKGGIGVSLARLAMAGACAGLAILTKLNGVLGLIVLAGWAGLLLLAPRSSVRRFVTFAMGSILAGLVAFGTFAALNPFLTAHPTGTLTEPTSTLSRLGFWERIRIVGRHRLEVPRQQQIDYPHNALLTLQEKAAAMTVQGFGRFGLFGAKRYDTEHGWWFDSTRRFDWEQDRGALIWLPVVLAGVVWAWVRGRRQRAASEPPTAWAILTYATVAFVVVTAYLPLAWDRFFLSVQAGSCLLAAGVIVAVVQGIHAKLAGPMNTSQKPVAQAATP